MAGALATRARQHGTVLIPLRAGWPGVDLHLHVSGRTWTGLQHGHGRVRHQQLEITVSGRGAATREDRETADAAPDPRRESLDTVREPGRPSTVVEGPWRATA